ncbi:PREDICTED: DNA-directed RNA polymerase III subunit RPC5-like [Camelina sativa]|uniref:DNA-directed RNA polymerase III subunit RPC5-like n=1 Tax=Camelina sativa TaxID=90675 RepID=A0ABM0X8D9_CAMSA|nr:PREDICTED: DNA-directed RNA polymerase III subunit RPC5-like [Camelina sativa]XP_010482229.1 PREDICTED: DNA-directed RNA polymerase III subunit RPC5-like [Camelina sativa]
MDFDDDPKPKEVAKTRRFAPGRAGKTKPKPKPEPPAAKPEQPASSQTESVSKSEHDVDAKSTGAAKVEPPEVYNGAVKMEIDPKVDKEPEVMETELIVEDQLPLEEEKMEEDDEEEEDVVVREIDVFFKPSIDANTELYVLQYPLRPSWRPYEMDERCQEVRVNPSTSQVEIDLSMDVHSKNYDSTFGVDMTKQTLKTTWKQPPTLDYAVGVLSGDKLHLNPVHAVAQLRPSMQYLSSDGKKKQAESTEESVGTSKKQNKEMQASTDQKPNNEDNWVALTYHGLQSENCSRYLNGMMSNGNSSLDFNMSPGVYINELCRGGSNKNSESKETSKRDLLSLPLKERVQKLLCEGPPLLRYSVLKHYASEFSDEDFLEALQEYGWLVQGLWTPKTSLLKLDGPVGASRDYLLCLFSKNTSIKYSEVEAMGVLKDKVKTMLTVFAKERPLLNDWKFKEPTDVSFIKSYPAIVTEQDNFLTEKKKKLESVMSTQGGKSRANNRRNVVGKNSSVTVKPEVPTTLSDKGGSSRNTIPRVVDGQNMPEELRVALAKALKKVFQTHKVCSYETICQGLRDLAVSTSNNPKADSGMAVNVALAVDAYQNDLREVISGEAVDIYGSFVSKSSPDHPEYDALRALVIKLLRDNPPGTRLMKAQVFTEGRTKLKREITNNEYIKVMHDLCETNSSGWVLQKAR